ncbi:thermonuclease family protein [Hoeflea olei]|uniref:TNase-like domain-containing protein n=1 Tax=Hoeflea olei TaxID=1480615 RepID=A0A1C1YV86_9HYPH|nr:thermonuclease family protein [Hoeflea olei]OCW57442.1 hypothetical protein AWJ14_14140 [Hoeflea olei]
MRVRSLTLAGIAALLPLALLQGAKADSRETLLKMIAGPVAATVVRIVDGDTVVVVAQPWPDQSVHVAVRLRGIDTPELRSTCPSFKRAAKQAKLALAEAISPGDRVELRNIAGGKFYGRVVADLSRNDENLGDMLVDQGLAVRYDGGRRMRPPCPASS